MAKLFSIIVPVHNCEKYIKRSVMSIINQSYSNIEVIIVNNASTDNSKIICEELEKKFSNVKLINIDEAGVSNARNIGIENASGDFIGFCDADDYMEHDIIRKVVDKFEKQDIGIVCCAYNTVSINGEILYKNVLDKNYLWTNYELASRILLDSRILGAVWNKFTKAELIKKNRFNVKLSMCEDCHFLISLLINNPELKIQYINDVGYNYVNNTESATNDINKIFNNDKLRYIESMESIRSECKLDVSLTRDLNAACVKLALNAYELLSNIYDNEQDLLTKRKKFLMNYLFRYKHDFLFNFNISKKDKIKFIIKMYLRRRK